MHTTAGYMIGAAATFNYVFDYKPDDVYWCTADCGWITGHSYVAFGPMLMGAKQVLFEGVPTYPDAGRCWEVSSWAKAVSLSGVWLSLSSNWDWGWAGRLDCLQVVDKYQVKQFYTAPTAIRSLMASGDHHVTKHSRSSLRVLGSVGEPINPEAWRWYHDVVGEGRSPIVDTWWQTETAGHMVTPLPTAWATKPGSASLPFFGVKPVIVDEKGNELEGELRAGAPQGVG